MPSFALIAEGITDQVVIEAILHAIYKGQDPDDELSVTHVQPTRDATDRSRQDVSDFGGWQQVLEHCSISEHIYEAIALNDYVVIHIDSDICWHELIDIDPNQDQTDLVKLIEELIAGKIDPEIYRSHREKFIFAVAIHSTECWVLPFYSKVSSDRNKINSCEGRLRTVLAKNKVLFKKEYKPFMELTKPMRQKKALVEAASHSFSLLRFISSLP